MPLQKALLALLPSGPEGFEGLIQQSLSALTGYHFYLAQSGTQSGRDLATARTGTILAVECKRYGRETELDQTELLGKLIQAEMTIPQLDVWILVSSRDAPEQLVGSLDAAGRRLGVDVQFITAAGDSPSTLEVLLAQAPDLVLRHLRAARVETRGLRSELRRIAEHPAFALRRDALRDAFAMNAGYASFRERTAALFVRQIGSDVESRAAFGQAINIEGDEQRGRLVRRRSLSDALDRWLSTWQGSHRPLTVLGEEGDGKTWAVASWLRSRIQHDNAFPPVLWIPSRDATEADWETLVTETIGRRLGGESERWRNRLRRWCENRQQPVPALIVVIDGLNERHEASWWRPLFESAFAAPWRQSCGLILTARTAFWPPIRRTKHLKFDELNVLPFSDPELDEALSQVGLGRNDLSPDILSLVRKPRYFDLAVQFRERLALSGDITVARLIYEDWRDRYARRNLPLDDSGFRDLISQLAAETLAHGEAIDQIRLASALAHLEERQAALRELETSGVLIREDSSVRVEPRRLALGLGLILARDLKRSDAHASVEQQLAEWLEPHSDMDLKAGIVESAVVHSMLNEGYSTRIRSALLAAWLLRRNTLPPTPYIVGAYFPNDPDAYFGAAECVWSDDIDDGVAQRALRSIFLRWRLEESLAQAFVRSLRRWLSFVHVDGSPVAIREEDRPKRREKLEAALGGPAPIGAFNYGGRSFVGIEDEGLLRLGRLSLGLVAEGDRRPYAAALVDAYVADSLMQFPEKSDLLRWVIRTSPHPLDVYLMGELQGLASSADAPLLKAAYFLAGAIGTSAALSVRDHLPGGLLPKNILWESFEADPCGAGFAWRIEDCAKCIGRSDLPSHLLAQQVGRCATDPELEIPSETAKRVEQLLETMPPERLWAGPSMTEVEHVFETVEPTLTRCDVPRWAGLIRQAAAEIGRRQGLSLRQLAYALAPYRLVLTPLERGTIETVWDRLVANWPSLETEDKRAEWLLFELMLDWLSPEEQLARLLRRPAEADLLLRFRKHFRAVDWGQIKRRLKEGSPRVIAPALFFASSNETASQARQDADLLSLVESEDPSLRALALHTIWLAGDPRDAQAIAEGGWYARPLESSYWENHWGSLLLAERSDLPYDELRARVELAFLGRVIERRNFDSTEVEKFAQDLDRIWNQIGGSSAVEELPPIELRVDRAQSDVVELPGLTRSAFSRSVTFLTRHWSWGGYVPQEVDQRLWVDDVSDEDIERAHAAMADVLSEQRAAGNEWFARRFDRHGLTAVVKVHPELVSKWTTPDPRRPAEWEHRLWRGRSFYETLCEILLEQNPVAGAELYNVLLSHVPPVRFVEDLTGIPVLDYALFSAPPAPPVVALWERRLKSSQTDRELLELALLCRGQYARQWLVDRLEEQSRSSVPFLRSQAILLSGFVSEPIATSRPPQPSDIRDWEAEMTKQAWLWRRRGEWAQEWLDRFATAEGEEEANAAFRLFLRCVDSRYGEYVEECLQQARPERRLFFEANLEEIERAVEANEKDLREHYLGQKVSPDQVWPWFDARTR